MLSQVVYLLRCELKILTPIGGDGMNIRRFLNIINVLTLLLPFQLLLGMWINLFVNIPDPVVSNFFTSGGGIVLVVHMLNGLAIIVLSIVTIVLATRFNKVAPLRLSIAAVVFVVLAIASGIKFDFFGQNDAFSYTMAIGFVLSVLSLSFAGRLAMQLR